MPVSEKWVERGLLVLGAVGTILAVFTAFGLSSQVTIAFLAGSGWALVIALLIMSARSRIEVARLETEVRDLREQTKEWRLIACNDSDSLNKIINRSGPAPRAAARRLPAPAEEAQPRQEEG